MGKELSQLARSPDIENHPVHLQLQKPLQATHSAGESELPYCQPENLKASHCAFSATVSNALPLYYYSMLAVGV